MSSVAERVDRLEEALMRLLYIQQKTEIELQNFKNEMKEFKEEMRAFKEEMKAFKDEMKVFKDEMLAFKDEMREFKDWSKKNIENLNRQWGNLANRLGTLVEDIFAPSLDRALERYFGVLPDVIDVKKLVRREGKSLEIDILALSEKEQKAYVVEVKSNPDRKEYIEEFLEKLTVIPEFLPQLVQYTLVGIYAGLTMSDQTVALLTRKKIYAMVFRGDFLEIVNLEALRG